MGAPLAEAQAPSPGRVLVTGGASGIGAATVSLLRARGAEAIPADLVPVEGGHHLDVTDESGWEDVLDRVWPLSGLVNAAGIRTRALLVDLAVEEFDRLMAVHARGSFLATRAVARRWLRQGRTGAIVHLASVVATHAVPGQVHYVASKAAVAMLTKAAAADLSPHGIRVNAIAPGAIRTPMTADRIADPQQLAWLQQRIPAGRVGEAHEIAAVIAFLLSEDASYLTGALLPVDGGWTAT